MLQNNKHRRLAQNLFIRNKPNKQHTRKLRIQAFVHIKIMEVTRVPPQTLRVPLMIRIPQVENRRAKS